MSLPNKLIKDEKTNSFIKDEKGEDVLLLYSLTSEDAIEFRERVVKSYNEYETTKNEYDILKMYSICLTLAIIGWGVFKSFVS